MRLVKLSMAASERVSKTYSHRTKQKESNLQALARWGLRNSLAPKIGKGRYAMAEYEKIKRITVPLENYHLLLVTTELETDHGKIIDNILKLLQS